MARAQISIFSILDDGNNAEYEKLRIEALKSKRKRYKNSTYTKFYKEDNHTDGSKTDSFEKWGNMNRLYVELANCFPYPTAFDKGKEIIQVDEDTSYVETGMIRTFKICYHNEKYTHRGDDGVTKTYNGEEFFYNYAEVIGTEDLGINERLFIHFWLIEFLDVGYVIEKLNMWLEGLVNMFQQGWTAELLVIFLLSLRCEK